MGNLRQQLEERDLSGALARVSKKLRYRAEQKGMGTMASSHEILGILDEEVSEYRDAVHENLGRDARIEELADIAVGAIWGIASISSAGTDW